MILYHGGARGFKAGDVIEPHETKVRDDCPICASGADANHLPDRVFATRERPYAKHYASKWGRGSLYIVEPVGAMTRSEADPFETYHAATFRVIKVSETQIELTPSERRRLYRLWTEADRARGIPLDGPAQLADMRMHRQLGIRA